jgi:phospholipid/cholesterol/gamma-HCH transport system ATP-binding protein
MRNKLGITSVIVTHDMECVRRIAERILIFHEGKIGAEGSYNELANSKIPWVNAFFL